MKRLEPDIVLEGHGGPAMRAAGVQIHHDTVTRAAMGLKALLRAMEIRRILKPDGLFLASMLGGESLVELREALLEAELATSGGASPRVSPMAGLGDAAPNPRPRAGDNCYFAGQPARFAHRQRLTA